jgi:hypothetical protein
MTPADPILATLVPTHPRLILDAEAIARIRETVRTVPLAGRTYARILSAAQEILGQPPSEYEIPDGRRLLPISRQVVERVRTLSFVYLFEGERRYVDRAWAEVEAAAAFVDWNPSHFLDTAEMTHALAIAYDWLYGEWDAAQRETLRDAIVTHGLEPAMEAYQGRGPSRWWPMSDSNWNQVCNGGIGMGALAIADERPDLAAEILRRAIASLPRAMGHYAPDGAGTEGVTYWEYGTRYNVLFLSALGTALGTDFGLSQTAGFDLSGGYHLYISGADRLAFDFGDCGLRRTSTPQHFWMGRAFDMPQYSWLRYSELERADAEGSVLDLLWFDDSARDYDASVLPLDVHYRVAECASMRSAWMDPDALVVGFQAGQNRDGAHRHLDLGSFILEALGERWIIDSGVERETYQRHRNHRQRWEFYRVRAEGHNTLVLNPDGGPDQALDASAEISFTSTPARVDVAVDLSQAYAGCARRVRRTLSAIDRAYVVLTDEIEADEPVELWWFAHTEAEVDLDGGGTLATLRQNGKRLTARINAPAGARFEVMDARPLPTSPAPEIQADNTDRRKLAIHLREVTDLRLTVRLMPVWDGPDTR